MLFMLSQFHETSVGECTIIHKCVAVRLYYDLVITTMKIDICGQFPSGFGRKQKKRPHNESKQASKQANNSLPPSQNRKLSLLARARAGQAQ